MTARAINNESEVNASELTFSNLRLMYGTGRSYTISGSGRDRKTGYRNGVMTKIGDIEESLWELLVNKLINNSGEQELHKNLLTWCKDNILFIKDQDEMRKYALRLHAYRIFDDEKWVGYADFNKLYRRETKN